MPFSYNGYNLNNYLESPWYDTEVSLFTNILNLLPNAGSNYVSGQHVHSQITTTAGTPALIASGLTGVINIPSLAPNTVVGVDASHNLIGITGIKTTIGPGTPGYLMRWDGGGTGAIDSFAHEDGSGNFIITPTGSPPGQIILASDAGIVIEAGQNSTTISGQEVYLDSYSGSVLNSYLSLNTSPAAPAASNCVAVRLATVDNIDLGVTGSGAKTDLYTVAYGQIIIVTSVLVRGSNLANVTVTPWCSVNSQQSLTFPIFDSRHLGDFGYDPMKNGYWFYRNSGDTTTDCFHLCYSGEVIQFSVDLPGVATNQTVSVDLFGYIM